jgi:hypothetical protein
MKPLKNPLFTNVFFEMLQYPNSPKPYRELKTIYFQLGKVHEANAIAYLLETKFNEKDNNLDCDQES